MHPIAVTLPPVPMVSIQLDHIAGVVIGGIALVAWATFVAQVDVGQSPRLARFFRLNLFAASGTGFEALLERGAVIRLSHLPGDEERGQTKTAVGEFLIRALYHYLVRRPQERRLRWMLGLDEAWRLGESTALQVLMREGRAFGLGVLLCSQFPRDVPMSLRGNAATQILFAQRLELVADAQRAVLGTTRGQAARQLAMALAGLRDHEAVVANRQLAPWGLVRVRPYFEAATKVSDGVE